MRVMALLYALLPSSVSALGATMSAFGAFRKASLEAFTPESDERKARAHRMSVLVVSGACFAVLGTLWSGLNQQMSSVKQKNLQSAVIEKGDENIKRSREIVAKSDEIASLNRVLAQKTEENSASRLRDQETRGITIERLIRTAATECITEHPDLKRELDTIHNSFEKRITENVTVKPEVKIDVKKSD